MLTLSSGGAQELVVRAVPNVTALLTDKLRAVQVLTAHQPTNPIPETLTQYLSALL